MALATRDREPRPLALQIPALVPRRAEGDAMTTVVLKEVQLIGPRRRHKPFEAWHGLSQTCLICGAWRCTGNRRPDPWYANPMSTERQPWCPGAPDGVAAMTTATATNMGAPYKCPVCDGTGLVSRTPGVAGDVPEWPAISTAPYPCRACRGTGLVWTPQAERGAPR